MHSSFIFILFLFREGGGSSPSLLLELFGVQGIQLRLELHDLESNLALHIHLLVIVEILEEIVIEIQALLNCLTSRLLVIVVIYRSPGLFSVLELMCIPIPNRTTDIHGGQTHSSIARYIHGVKQRKIHTSSRATMNRSVMV